MVSTTSTRFLPSQTHWIFVGGVLRVASPTTSVIGVVTKVKG
jgi:hypothetical protein